MIYTPTLFVVEIFCGCNFRCVECPVGDGSLTRKKGYMTFEKYKIIADKIAPYSKYVFLHCWGEPMLNPDVFKIIEYSNSLGLRNNISINGQLINEEKAKLLATSGTDINFSLDAFTQKTFEMYRKRGNVEKVKQAAINLIKYKDDKTTMRIQMCVFEHNKHEIQLVENFSKELGVDFAKKTPYVRNNTQLADGWKRGKWTTEIMKKCRNCENTMTIYLDGSVVLCCHDFDGETTYGNIFNNNVIELYNSEEFNKIRIAVKNGTYGFCHKGCLAAIK